jgi:hypothetical protein
MFPISSHNFNCGVNNKLVDFLKIYSNTSQAVKEISKEKTITRLRLREYACHRKIRGRSIRQICQVPT